MKPIKRITTMWMFISFLLLIFTGISFAVVDYPVKPIAIIVPYSPGGGSDITSRIMASVWKKYSPKPLIILNRPGASGTRGIYDLVKSKPDGYTVAFASNSEACSVLHLVPAKYTLDSYKIICGVDSRLPVVFTKGPWNNLKELIDYSRKNPDKIRVGVPGMGTIARLIGELIAAEAGVKWKMVPFQGGGPLIPAVLGGHVEIGILWHDNVMGLYKAGDLKVLCLMSDKRSKLLPKVPAAKEQGFRVEGNNRHFIIVPNGVPKPIREKLDSLMKKVIEDPEFVKRLATLGNDAGYMDSESCTAFLEEWYKTSGNLFEILGMIKKK